MEKINILMATYNGRRYVAKQIESILNQTYSNFRLIISDDGSTDSTVKILQQYEEKDSRIEVYSLMENRGIVANFEFLIEKVRSELFMFADQDDIWEPDKIEKSLKKMEDEDLDLVYTDLEVVDAKLNQIAPSYWVLKGLDYRIKKYNNFESLFLNNFVTGCTMLVKSKWINEFMPLPKNSKNVLHDYWISLIISQKGKIGYLDEATMKYRQHNHNNIGSRTRAEGMETLDEVRDLFIDVKLDHFTVFIKNKNKFISNSYRELSEEALKYYEYLKSVKNFTFKGIGLFLKLYKYEAFSYKIKNFVILHIPCLARPYFKKLKQKRMLEEEARKKLELEEKINKEKRAAKRREEKLKKQELEKNKVENNKKKESNKKKNNK